MKNFKTIFSIFIIVSCFSAFLFLGLKSLAYDKDSGTIIKDGTIVIKAFPDDDNIIAFSVSARQATINWRKAGICINEKYYKEDNGYFTAKFPSNEKAEILIINTKALKSFKMERGNCQILKIGDCPQLEILECNNNDKLSILTIKKAEHLQNLECYGGSLKKLDLKNCKNLKELYCGNNKISNLNLSSNIKLRELYCFNNLLTSLNLKNNIYLERLFCYDNNFTANSIKIKVAKDDISVEPGDYSDIYDWLK